MEMKTLQYGKSTEILQFIIKSGMLDLNDVQDSIEAMKREELLKKHQYKVWQGKDGKWYTYLPDEKKGRVLKKKSTKNKMEDLIILYYKQEREKEDKETCMFRERYSIWVKRQKDCGVTDNTVTKYESDYKRFFEESGIENRRVCDITDDDITVFLIERIKEKSLNYRAAKSMFSMLNGIFEKSVKDKIITRNPCKYVDLPVMKKFCKEKKAKSAAERIVSDEQMKKFYEQFECDHKVKPQYIPTYAVELATLTGMRSGELSGLMWENIDFKKKYIVVCQSEKYNRKSREYYIDTTKNGKERIIPMTEEMGVLLKKIKKVETMYGYLSQYVFSNENGRVHARTISDCARNKGIQIGIEGKSIHAMRRTFNSKLRSEGVSAVVASSILGHTEKVNDNNYTYDASDMDYKREVVSNVNREIVKLCTIAE